MVFLGLAACVPTDPVSPSGTEGSDTTSEGPSVDSTGMSQTDTEAARICGNGVIDDDEDCDDGGESAVCNDDCTIAACGDGIVNATAGEGCDDEGESASCNDDCTIAACGDGIVNATAGEGCDDEGESASCNDDCTIAACGDGIANPTADEDCDDEGESAACNDDCTIAACGDGIVNATAGEDCDDQRETATCDLDCTLAECGDGYVNRIVPEQCDDMGESDSCNSDCSISGCGDGILNMTDQEECDDGGKSAACDADCTLAECGDGLFNAMAGEECDEGMATALCDADCTPVECGDGFTNMVAGESCDDAGESPTCNSDCSIAACGDGITNVTAGEDCDDIGESLSCDDDCTDVVCGDMLVNTTAGEVCDSNDLQGGTCAAMGFFSGTLACDLGCAFDTAGCSLLPEAPLLMLGFSQIKRFNFSWAPALGADYYQLEQSVAPGEPFVQLGGDIVGVSVSHTMPLHLRRHASYRLRACNVEGCRESVPVDVLSSLAEAVGYVKASNTDSGDRFGTVALSADGTTLAVGSNFEDSSATGVDGDQLSNATADSGAVYVFVHDGMGLWSQQAYLKASNPDQLDRFAEAALSADGNTLVVSAYAEDSGATGIDGDQASNTTDNSGALYVFVRDGMNVWSQQAYLKASNTGVGDFLGWYALSLSDDGSTLAVGAYNEDSASNGIDGDQGSGAGDSGAVYVFVRDPTDQWSQQAYVKAPNTGSTDFFGISVALSGDASTLAVGAIWEDSNATGIGGDQANGSESNSGAVYLY